MKKIMMSIIIISCLLNAAFLNVSGQELINENADVDTIKMQIPSNNFNYDAELMIDYSYTHINTDLDETDFNSRDSTEASSQSGGLDFAITEFNAWYSPFPPVSGYEDWKYECSKFSIINIGDIYAGYGHIQILFTIINDDGSEHTYTYLDVWTRGIFFKNFVLTDFIRCYDTQPQYCNAIKAKLELITTLPDSNPNNNILTVNFTEGVTFWGQVYEKNIFTGDTHYADMAVVLCESDCDKVIGPGKVTGFCTYFLSDIHPFYTSVSPKNPNKPAHNYKMKASLYRAIIPEEYYIRINTQTKYSGPLNGMSYKTVDFTFLTLLNINQNSQSTPQSQPQTQPSTQPSSEPTSKTSTQTTIDSTTLLNKITTK